MKSPCSSSSLPLLEEFVGVLSAHCSCFYGSRPRRRCSQPFDLVEDRARRPPPLAACATSRSPSRCTIVTSLSVASKPMSAREMSLTTTASRPLRASLSRPRSTAPSPCSAAKPTSVWSGPPRGRERGERRPSVGSSSMLSPSRPSFVIFVVGRRRPGGSRRPRRPSAARRPRGSARAPPPRARRRSRRRRTRTPAGSAAAPRWRRPPSRRRRAAPPPRRARSPSGPTSGCRRSARSRSARACRRR